MAGCSWNLSHGLGGISAQYAGRLYIWSFYPWSGLRHYLSLGAIYTSSIHL
jgi:hypothetical protein